MAMNILSLDIEEIFHTEYARNISKVDREFRTPKNIELIIDLLEEQGIVATFFVVGEIAEKFPQVINMIMAAGHEVAFHSWSHLPLWEINAISLAEEIVKFKEIFPDCIGYRAPSFSLNNKTSWALKVLRENGFRYDSSIFPSLTPLYGVPGAPIRPYRPSIFDVSKVENVASGIYEFPLAVYKTFGLKIPISGGFWLRFWNIGLIKKGIKKLNSMKIPAVIFVHNWEIDPETPKLKLNPYRSFVTYHNLEKVNGLLKDLLGLFSFTSFANYIDQLI
jgi:polysaccharide deacetylase family protein (PEP-CTERM system associated)